jgi:nucleotide-binding universal stress UspA family protein
MTGRRTAATLEISTGRCDVIKRLLIATDGSGASHDAVEEGLELAGDLVARVVFVYVKPVSSGLLGSPFYQRKLTREAGAAQAAIDKAVEAAEEHDVESDWEILEGDPAEQIVGLATERDADLIVVGSHGRGAVTGALLGSVSRAVVHEADRPVYVARTRTPRRLFVHA